MTNLTRTACIALLIQSSTVFAAETHSEMNHSAHSMNHTSITLSEAGNDAFGTIQEVIQKLINDPDTDWKKVNIEALRKHLQDMHDMTLNVEVISQTPIPNGLKAIIRPTTQRAEQALDRVFAAHPGQLQRETGWTMQVTKSAKQYSLVITSKDSSDADKIRGLGYIGLMAYGNHHQPHHWGMATGNNPHTGHH